MRRYLKTQGMGFFTSRLHDFRRHFQFSRLPFDLRVQHTAGDHQLNQIRLVLGDLTNKRPCLFRGGRLIRQRSCHVATWYRNRHISRQNPRSVDSSRQHRVADFRINVLNAADRADRRYAAHQLCLCVPFAHLQHDFAQEIVACHQLDQFLRITLFLLRLAVGRQMNVQIDQPRHDVLPFQIDDLRAFISRLLRLDRNNFFPFGNHSHPRLRFHVLGTI